MGYNKYGGYLKHARTKGSKNGVSNTPGYVATGTLARGRRLPNGEYVYDNPEEARRIEDAQTRARLTANIRAAAERDRQEAGGQKSHHQPFQGSW